MFIALCARSVGEESAFNENALNSEAGMSVGFRVRFCETVDAEDAEEDAAE